jgi:hypothetical protein
MPLTVLNLRHLGDLVQSPVIRCPTSKSASKRRTCILPISFRTSSTWISVLMTVVA